ncbi:MAG: DMT family transporter [Anaerolineae bacterium]|nr:DMT family transporter [Anaerolineae bacterium]
MFALVLATFFSASFGLVLRYAHGQRCNLWAVGLTNYIVATAFHLVRSLGAGSLRPSVSTVMLGVVSGVLYAVNYWLYFSLIQRRGVSVTTAIVRLAVLIPIGASVMLWNERPEMLEAAGVLLALASLPLLTMAPAPQGGGAKRQGVLALAMLLGSGLSMLTVEAFDQIGPVAEHALFLALLFGSAGLVAGIGWLSHGARFARTDLLPGVGLGLCNAIANAALLIALQQLPGVLVFPFYSAVGVAFTSIFARLVWREQMRRQEVAGMAVAMLAVVLMNLG